MTQSGVIYSEDKLIEACKKGKKAAQQALYVRYADTMFAICLRYLKSRTEAEDMLVNGFMKVFEKIGQYEGKGSLEGWIRRLMVNECLMLLRKNDRLRYMADVQEVERVPESQGLERHMEAEELMQMIRQLPEGYQTVFNLYAIEGYTHKEIGELLGISEGTSKSQLNKARKFLQRQLKQYDAMTDQGKKL